MARGWFESEDDFRRRLGLEAKAPLSDAAGSPGKRSSGWVGEITSILAPLLAGYVFVAIVIGLFDFDLGVSLVTRPVTWIFDRLF